MDVALFASLAAVVPFSVLWRDDRRRRREHQMRLRAAAGLGAASPRTGRSLRGPRPEARASA
ncbi:MAG: hypothetical protein KY434_10255 [Actinobacteria bacterium]|nr:hypothetical protein [Actinomycetota bacterium]